MTITKPLWDRFWPKVEFTGFCWNWTAGTSAKGYGCFRLGGHDGKRTSAHRVAYELLVGPIPDGLELDHLCRNRRCVNPDHLEPVTGDENKRRSPAMAAHRSRLHTFTKAARRKPQLDRVVPSLDHDLMVQRIWG